jgi:hypothetical protein
MPKWLLTSAHEGYVWTVHMAASARTPVLIKFMTIILTIWLKNNGVL